MSQSSKIFTPFKSLGYVTNHIPIQVRYIKSRKENLIVTCIGRSFHTYGISHFGLLTTSGLHPSDITALSSDAFHVYTAASNHIYAWRRGFELKHTYKAHSKPVHLLLPFGPHLISIDEDSQLKVWDIKEETLHLELSFFNDSFQISSIVHPATYINKILLGSQQGEMQLWNLNTAKLIFTFEKCEGGISCLEQAPAIDVVAVGLTTGKILLLNLKYNQVLLEFHQDWGLVTSITFRTDGSPIMATASLSGHVVFWNLDEKRVSNQIICAHDGPITSLIALSNEPLILTSSPDNTLKLWIMDQCDNGARLLRIREGHSASPTCIRFHGSNGHNVLSAGSDSTLRIFNTQTEQFNKSLGKASFNRKASKKKRRDVEDTLIMPPIVNFCSEATREKEWDGIAALHLGLPLVTTWSYDKKKMGEKKLLPNRFQKGKEEIESATCLTLTNCGNFVVIGYSSGHIDRFNIQSGLWRDTYGKLKAHDAPVRGVYTDGLNQMVVSGCSSGFIKFHAFKCNGCDATTIIPIENGICFFKSHRNSSMLALTLDNFDIYVLDIDTRRIIRKFIGHTAQITDITLSHDSRWLISASMDCTIKTWDIPSAQLVDQFGVEVACNSLSISPTGEMLATAHVDYLGIYLWTNRSLYEKINLKALTPSDDLPILALPETIFTDEKEKLKDKEETEEFVSPECIGMNLITLSGLASSRWANLLNMDVIKARNKPKQTIQTQKAAPFFLPTVQSLNFQFDLTKTSEEKSILLMPNILVNLSDFGKLLNSVKNYEFEAVVKKLKMFSPSMINFEIKLLAPEEGGSVELMLKFLQLIEFMLKANRNFELVQAYLSVFLKEHGTCVARNKELRSYLTNVQSCQTVVWNRLQNKMLFSLCLLRTLKNI